MLVLRRHEGNLAHPIETLEDYFQKAGSSLIRVAFAHSYFIHPDSVRQRVVQFPDRARLSRKHYPRKDRGNIAIWVGDDKEPGDGREVKLSQNQQAQRAYASYTGHALVRKSGYSVRHIWGHPWNPDAFTAGWNLCYMPFWAGMLTEEQHPHEGLERAIRQAAWDIYFRQNPVCEPPSFVEDPGLDLDALLDGQPILLLGEGK